MKTRNTTPDGLPSAEAIVAITTHLNNFIEGVDFIQNPHYTPAMRKEDAIMLSESGMSKVNDWIVRNEYPTKIINLHTGQVCTVRYANKDTIDSAAPCLKHKVKDASILFLEFNRRHGHGYQIRKISNGVTASVVDDMPIKIGEAAIGLAMAIDTTNSKENGQNTPDNTIFVTRDSIIANFRSEFGNNELFHDIENGECNGFTMSIYGRDINIAVV